LTNQIDVVGIDSGVHDGHHDPFAGGLLPGLGGVEGDQMALLIAYLIGLGGDCWVESRE